MYFTPTYFPYPYHSCDWLTDCVEFAVKLIELYQSCSDLFWDNLLYRLWSSSYIVIVWGNTGRRAWADLHLRWLSKKGWSLLLNLKKSCIFSLRCPFNSSVLV